jgi:hypothetical protein
LKRFEDFFLLIFNNLIWFLTSDFSIILSLISLNVSQFLNYFIFIFNSPKNQNQSQRLHQSCRPSIRGQFQFHQDKHCRFSVHSKAFQLSAKVKISFEIIHLKLLVVFSRVSLGFFVTSLLLLSILRNFFIYQIFTTEPVNLRPPVFNTESKTSHFEKPMGTHIALLAQVQAFPLPSIRSLSHIFTILRPQFFNLLAHSNSA